MSYRFITRATLSITDAAGYFRTRLLEVRAYPSPKRDASGTVTVDGTSVPYKRTGGKGRGTLDRRYVYAEVRGESAYFEISEEEAAALVGGTVSLVTAAASLAAFAATFVPPAESEAPAPVATEAEALAEYEAEAEELAESEAAIEAEAEEAPRRAKRGAKT